MSEKLTNGEIRGKSEYIDLAGWFEPLDAELRRDWCEANVDIYTESYQIVDEDTTVTLRDAARNRLRYEATLQELEKAKDAQIAALVIEWEGLLTQLLPSGEKAIVCLPSGALWSFDAIIKEATQ